MGGTRPLESESLGGGSGHENDLKGIRKCLAGAYSYDKKLYSIS